MSWPKIGHIFGTGRRPTNLKLGIGKRMKYDDPHRRHAQWAPWKLCVVVQITTSGGRGHIVSAPGRTSCCYWSSSSEITSRINACCLDINMRYKKACSRMKLLNDIEICCFISEKWSFVRNVFGPSSMLLRLIVRMFCVWYRRTVSCVLYRWLYDYTVFFNFLLLQSAKSTFLHVKYRTITHSCYNFITSLILFCTLLYNFI